MFGIVKADARIVPLSGLLTGEQTAGLISDSESSTVFVSKDCKDRIEPHRQHLSRVQPQNRIAVDFVSPAWKTFMASLDRAPDTTPPIRYYPDDDFNMIYSSETTGLPKGILQSHRARTHFAISNMSPDSTLE